MITDSLPNYSVQQLNQAIGTLLERGFAPRFLVTASVSKSQLKKGHLWLTLIDGKASITAVVWSSRLQNCGFIPKEGDGIVIVGKLNFWEIRATLVVQVLDMRPSISTVLRQFEIVKALMMKEGWLDESLKKSLPSYPKSVAILTSVPSSALADMLRTAQERWPLTKLFIVPIPVQGSVAKKIQSVLQNLAKCTHAFEIDAIVLARGGGSREDLMVFDDEGLCRDLANFSIPIVTGLGHEDDLTVADLIADHRAATPTAAIVDLLPCLEIAQEKCLQRRHRLSEISIWFLRREREKLLERKKQLLAQSPYSLIKKKREILLNKFKLLQALSPQNILLRGFSIVQDPLGKPIRSIHEINEDERLTIQLSDGQIETKVDKIYL